MNLNNSKYNYARKFKAILKYLLFAIPLIMVLVAVLFPIKTTTNTYDGSNTSVTESTSSVMFNQLVKDVLYDDTSLWQVYKGTYEINEENTSLYTGNENGTYFGQYNFNITAYHKYYMKVNVKSLSSTSGTLMLFMSGSPSSLNYTGNGDWQTLERIVTPTLSSNNALLLFYAYSYNTEYEIKYFQLIDLTEMYGSGNEPTMSDFTSQFPLDYYEYNQGELLMLHEVEKTTTINDTDLIWYTTDTKQLNTPLLTPMTEFYGASINSWYESFLTAFQLDYDTASYMYYLVHMPLWIMYVVLLDLLLDIVLLVPCLLHNLVHKYKGDD